MSLRFIVFFAIIINCCGAVVERLIVNTVIPTVAGSTPTLGNKIAHFSY